MYSFDRDSEEEGMLNDGRGNYSVSRIVTAHRIKRIILLSDMCNKDLIFNLLRTD